MVSAILENPSVDINCQDPELGINSFWLAAYFGQGDIMQILAEEGIEVLNHHKHTLSNALHVAVERNYPNIVRMLIKSKFPLDDPKSDGVTPLIIACRYEFLDDDESIAKMLVDAGACINCVTTNGQSALS